jgi:Skp family chaperone for outer membrane proteins
MSMKLDRMGWFVAVALIGVMCGSGFKAPTDKVGSVDINKVFADSDYSKKQQEQLREAGTTRRGVLDLLHAYAVMRPEDAQRFADLSLKEKPTPEDKAEEDKITQAAKDADTIYRGLATKANPTPAELAQIEDFNRRKDRISVLQQQWAQQFQDQMNAMTDKVRTDAVGKVREAIGQVARDQGYSVVFSTEFAPYCSNDLTDAATKAINKLKN